MEWRTFDTVSFFVSFGVIRVAPWLERGAVIVDRDG